MYHTSKNYVYLQRMGIHLNRNCLWGVVLLEQTRVNEISFSNEEFNFFSTKGSFKSKAAAGCFGKRSNLDIKWKRSFVLAKKNKLNNYIGVKYHIRYNFPND